MKKRFLLSVLMLISFIFIGNGEGGVLSVSGEKTDKEKERLLGPVKTVLIEMAEMSEKDGKWVAGTRMPWTSTTYDSQGRRIEEDQLYNDEPLNFKSVFIYDANGRLKEGVEYDYQGVIAFTWSYIHETETKMIEERYRPDGSLFSKSIYLYDPEGNLIEETRSHTQTANGFKWVYRYDKAGKKVEESFYLIRSKGLPNQTGTSLNYRSVYSYDDKGRLTEETQYDPAGGVKSEQKFRYEYDDEGNWTSQTAWQRGDSDGRAAFEPIDVTYRTITYYPQ
ncbi:MAG: hypothetical protein ACE5J1_06170 [Nitrospiria bacterium]